MEFYAIIMSGGRGKRFWPLSQVSLPKQFLTFTGESSLFAQTFQNLRQVMPASHIFTVTRQAYHSIILDQVREFLPENIIVEPVQNNTGPCIALGVSYVRHFAPDSVVVVLPADHYFDQKDKFLKALENARRYAEEKPEIMTFGIKPDFPHTGYGYIQVGDLIESLDGFDINRGVRFVEKPNLETARDLLKDGRYFWNSGIFCARTDVFQEAFRKHLSVVYKNILDFQHYIGTAGESHKLFEIYERMLKISFD